MSLLIAISIGLLFGTGAYMLMRRSLVKLVVGLVLLGQAANLLIFATSAPERGRPPLISVGQDTPPSPFTDPLASALVLTAIVISFGIASYTIVLIKRAYQDVGSDDLNLYKTTDR
ncbi:MAG: NADH-quinone oxidoreductase subunit K [Planctomycetota bacterium]